MLLLISWNGGIRRGGTPGPQLQNTLRWGKNILRGRNVPLGVKCTKYNKINNNSEKFKGTRCGPSSNEEEVAGLDSTRLKSHLNGLLQKGTFYF